MSAVIRWEDPPRINVGRKQIRISDQALVELRTNPGHWALVIEGISDQTAMRVAKRHPELEITRRQVAPGSNKCNVYARYPKGEQ